MADLLQPSALMRRHDQLKRWEESDTNKAVKSPPPESRKVKFQDGCIFLAACSSGDRDEVLRMLDKGADINTANVDGLTALHQACIDDNLDMVEFLVDHGADVDVCDNEGWTPLHATASCGFSDIARYLIGVNANVAAVNNDGDLPFDICEDVEMENLLQAEMESQGVDADAARQEEENQMLADANKWLNNKSVREKRHPKTGATALHVACAKGYMKVISILMQAGIDINAKDCDGWTPLHAAAHWGQEEACKVLAEHMCDFDIKNNAGHTAFDVADSEIVKLLEELKQKQASLKDTNSVQNEVIQMRGQQQKRRPDKPLTIIEPTDNSRSSVTRMSGDQKQSVTLKTKERGDPSLIHNKTPEEEQTVKSSSSEAEESSESETGKKETEKQNAINNQTSEVNNQARDRDKPPITTTVEIQKPEMPKIDEKGENVQVPDEKDVENEDDRKDKEEVPRIEKMRDTVDKLTEKEKGQEKDEKEKEEKIEEKQEESKENKKEEPRNEEQEKSISGRGSLSRSLSAPAAQDQVPSISVNRITSQKEDEVKQRDIPSWRAGLRKTGSTSLVTETVNSNEGDKALLRSASSPRLPVDSHQKPDSSRVSFQDTTSTAGESQDSRLNERFGSQYGNRIGSSSYRRPTSFTSSSSYTSSYIPFHQRQQDSSRLTTSSLTTTTNSSLTTNAGMSSVTTTSSIASSSSITSPQSNFSINRRSYEPPKRDEEAETQRKARAKRARETRRSTQGVTLEDIQKAEEVLGSSDKSKLPTTSSTATTTTTTTEDKSRVTDLSSKDSDIPRTSSYSSLDSTKKDTSEIVPRRRAYEEKKDDDVRSSYRRSRDSKDYNTTDSAYIPRRERNALSSSDGTIASSSSSSLNPGTGLSRASSLRNRIRNGELVDRDENKESNKENKEAKDSKDKDTQEKSHDMRAVRARKTRRERRSTGIVSYDAKNDDDDEKEEEKKEDKKEEKKETDDKNAGSRYSGRYSSTSDVGTSDKYSSRPSSYIDHYRSTPSLDSDYKRLYEEEKSQNDKLKKELERTKKDLLEAKTELDRLVRRNEAQRVTDTNDKREKRALERKLSELEEEVKKMEVIKEDNRRLKDENGALIRVISKLSK